MVKILGLSNKTNFDYTFGGKLDVFGKLIVANDATIDGKFTIKDNIHILGKDASNAKIKIEDNSNGFPASEINVANGGRNLRIAAPQDIYFEDVDTGEKHLYIENGGNIGIGTIIPQEKLHIHEGDIVIGQDSGNNTGITNYIKFGRADAPKAAIGFINNSGNGRGDIIFMNDNDGNSSAFDDSDERVRITRQGRVGIASDNPQRTLDVVGSIRKTVYEPGEIIETLQGVCDGNNVTVQSGTYTLTNVNALQEAGNNYATMSGSSINYTPPPGTTRVCYEFWVFMRDSGGGNSSRPLLHFQSQLDNSSGTPTIINNSRHTWRFATDTDIQDVQTWVYNKAIVSIGQVDTESVANGRLVSWDSARTFRWRFRRYSSSFHADLHETQHWDGTGTNVRVRPHVKITAIA